MFVRYVSHEIRTPLNTVFLGLKFLRDELAADVMRGERDGSMLATVDDIQSSCEVAVNILNDLLTYEKLEGGILQTQMKRIDACAFVRETVRPFVLQVSLVVEFVAQCLTLACILYGRRVRWPYLCPSTWRKRKCTLTQMSTNSHRCVCVEVRVALLRNVWFGLVGWLVAGDSKSRFERT